MQCTKYLILLHIGGLLVLNVGSVLAAKTNVAVAANFTEAAKEIGRLFQQATGHKALFSFGSTGKLYTQISQGAPFDVFLAADQKRPQKAIAENLAEASSRFTYATGKIVLFSTDNNLVKDQKTLQNAKFSKIAIANPVTAPYGAAAVATLRALHVYKTVAPRIVQGNNIAQTYQFIKTTNAELGFIALSQIAGKQQGSHWVVPTELYPELAQDAVMLKHGQDNPAAYAFLKFLKGSQANNIKAKYGYGSGDN